MKKENHRGHNQSTITGRFIETVDVCRICGKDLTEGNRVQKSWGKMCRSCQKEKFREYYQKHRARLRKEVGGKCFLTGEPAEMYHHVVPVEKHQNRAKYERDSDLLLPVTNSAHKVWHELKEWLGLVVM